MTTVELDVPATTVGVDSVRARWLLRAGIGIFVALGGVSAVWWWAAGHLPLSYVLVMIPASAIGVVCMFFAFLSTHFGTVRSDIAGLATLGERVTNHDERILVLERQYGELRDEFKKVAARDYLETVKARQSSNGSGQRLRIVDPSTGGD